VSPAWIRHASPDENDPCARCDVSVATTHHVGTPMSAAMSTPTIIQRSARHRLERRSPTISSPACAVSVMREW
jgi:hypothetical protein